MTEAEWLACTDPQRMLEFLRDKASNRKLRLFACACCRLISQLFLDDRLLQLFGGFEREVDGQATAQDYQLRKDWVEEQEVLADSWGLSEIDDERRRQILSRYHRQQTHNVEAMQALGWVLDWDTAILMGAHGEEPVDAWLAATGTAHTVTLAAGNAPTVRKSQIEILRDIFSNTLRPVSVTPSVFAWNGGLVVRLAQVAYEDRHLPAGTLDNTRLAILADALEEAGCTNADILNHCRQPGEHVRGCWVVDLLLGKE